MGEREPQTEAEFEESQNREFGKYIIDHRDYLEFFMKNGDFNVEGKGLDLLYDDLAWLNFVVKKEYDTFIRRNGDTEKNRNLALIEVGSKGRESVASICANWHEADYYNTYDIVGTGDTTDNLELNPTFMGLKTFIDRGDELRNRQFNKWKNSPWGQKAEKEAVEEAKEAVKATEEAVETPVEFERRWNKKWAEFAFKHEDALMGETTKKYLELIKREDKTEEFDNMYKLYRQLREFGGLKSEHKAFIEKYGDNEENRAYSINEIGFKAKNKFLKLDKNACETFPWDSIKYYASDKLLKFLNEGSDLRYFNREEEKSMETKLKRQKATETEENEDKPVFRP